jgi:hypothetical protein
MQCMFMTQNEYELYRRRLDEQLESGIELLKAAHEQQVRALEMVWTMGRSEEGVRPAPSAVPAKAPAALPPPSRPARRGAWELANDVEAALPGLPDVFNRNDVVRALGYEPDRASLYRVLQDLAHEGTIVQASIGGGRIPTTYRKTGTGHSPAQS